MLQYFFQIFFICLCALVFQGFASSDEERLVRDLFKGYNKLIRPVKNISEIINVEFTVALFQIINVDEKNQIMKSNVWLTMQWTDYQLAWDPSEYGGIAAIRLPPDKVWKPDIVLFNNADGNYEVSYKPNTVIYNSGLVLFVPPAIYKSDCTINVVHFPFDEQECKMKFGSWTYNANEVTLSFFDNNQQMTVTDYIVSGSWDLLNCPGNVNMSENGKNYIIEFALSIRRKSLFYTINLIIPCVLISFLSVLLFYLPADEGEKMTLGISVLLSLVVFMLLVSKILPPSSQALPLISKYLLFTFIMNIISILVTVVIINYNHRSPSTYTMPNWIRVVFIQFLPKLLFFKRPTKRRSVYRLSDDFGRVYGVPSLPMSDAVRSARKAAIADTIFNKLIVEASKAVEAVDFVASHMRDEDEDNQAREDWKYVALVIDRLQLYIFFAVTATGTASLLMNAPHIFEFVDQALVIKKLTGDVG